MGNKAFYRIKDKFKHIGAGWDELALDKDEAIEYAHTHINPEPQRMIDTNHYTMEYCLAHSGESVNERFRQDRADNIDLQHYIPQIQTWFCIVAYAIMYIT